MERPTFPAKKIFLSQLENINPKLQNDAYQLNVGNISIEIRYVWCEGIVISINEDLFVIDDVNDCLS